jgi:hypothetical protein
VEISEEWRPQAREEGLVLQELPDELLIYDLDRHWSHCLNRTAARIWRHCDGSRSVSELASGLLQELGTPVEEEAVWLVLHRLSRACLLQEKVRRPTGSNRATRRALLRRLGAVGGAALVSSIAVPSAMAAGSNVAVVKCTATCCTPGSDSTKCCFCPDGFSTCVGDCGSSCNATTCTGHCVGSNCTPTCVQHFCA